MATVSAMMASSVTGSFILNSRSSTVSTGRIISRPAPASRRLVNIRCNADPESKSIPSGGASSMPRLPLCLPPQLQSRRLRRRLKCGFVLQIPSFAEVFAFSGSAPETIDGRLATLGFVAAVGAELATGESLISQLGDGGVSAFVFAAILFSTASLTPLFKGVTPQSKSKAFFSSDAEIWNGRAAMIGLVTLAITEFVNGSALI